MKKKGYTKTISITLFPIKIYNTDIQFNQVLQLNTSAKKILTTLKSKSLHNLLKESGT